MKILFLLSGILVFGHFQLPAQQAPRWEFGIQAESGKDWYHRDYDEMDKLPDGYIENFQSYRSMGVGFFAERILNERFSALAQIGYLHKKMPVEIFDETSRTYGQWVTKETHHRGAVDIGMRWYVNPKARLRVFVDGKLGANMLIAAVRRVEGLGNVVNRDAFGYQRINPVASGSVGAKWGRLAISAEYRQNVVPVKRSRTSISGKAVVGKIAFTLLRAN